MFGTAGVRGVFNRSQTLDEVYKLTSTASFVFGKGRYGVGWDGRKSSLVLARTAASSIIATGNDVLEFGMVATPVVAFGTSKNKCLVGLSVTASHNPPEFSGVKFFDEKGMEFDEVKEGRVERALVVESRKTRADVGSLFGRNDVLSEYVDAVLSKFGVAKKRLKIVVDCANGPGGSVTPIVLSRLGHKVIPLNSQTSWRFVSRQPEPTVDNLRDTCNFVRECGADFGFAHDGDADRLVIIDSAGQLAPDSVTTILALKAIGVSSGSVILSENTSSAVVEEAERLGLDVVRGKIGKTFAKIISNNAVFASEPSKIVDPRWGMWEDGIYAVALITDAVSRDASLLGIIGRRVEWMYRQINLPVKVDLEKLSESVEQVFGRFKILEKRQAFGLKLVFRDGSWIMFRTSGTEPKTRIYCESRDSSLLGELLQEGIKCVETVVRRTGP